MSKADISTTLIRSRRAVLAGIAAAAALPIAAALPVAAPAIPSLLASSPIGSHPDAELLALAEEYIAAEQKWCDLNLKVDRMEGEFNHRRKLVPEILHWLESDAELGLPSLWPVAEDHPPIWDRPVDVNKIREAKWRIGSKYETEDETTVTLRNVTPSAAARARANEIIEAFDEWHKEGKPPRGYKKAVREKDKAERAYIRIEHRIRDMRAAGLGGMLAKIRCAQAYAKFDEIDNIEGGSCAEGMAISIFRDIQELAKTA